MVQRAVSRQVCRVCGGSCTSSLSMDEHLKEHGTNWPIQGEGIVMAHRVKQPERPREREQVTMAMFSADKKTIQPGGPEQQMEFVPHLNSTPWGRELR